MKIMKVYIYHYIVRLVLLVFSELLMFLIFAGISNVLQIVVFVLIFLYWLIYIIYELTHFHNEKQFVKRNLNICIIITVLISLGIIIDFVFLIR